MPLGAPFAVSVASVSILSTASCKPALPTASDLGEDTSPPVGSCAATLGCRRVT